jgi:hypothetical protein
VETLFAAALAISVGDEVLSEFTEPGNSVCEDNAVTLDNILGFDQLRRSGVAFQAGSAAINFGRPTMLRTRLRL